MPSGGTAAGWGGQPPPPSGPGIARANPSVGDVIETMFRIYRDTFPTTAAVLAVLLLPGAVLLGVAFLQVGDLWSAAMDSGLVTQVTEAEVRRVFSQPLLWIAGGVGALLLLLGQLAVIPALIRVGADHLGGDDPTLGRSLATGARRMWGIAGVWILLFLAIAVVVLAPLVLVLALDEFFGMLFLLTVPVGIAAALVATMVGYLVASAVVVEDRGALESLGRVRQLLRGTFWPTFGRGLLVGVLVSLIGQVLGFAAQFAVFAGPEAAAVAFVLVSLLGYLVSTPLGVYGGLSLYGDLRVRSEGTDVLGAAGRLDG